MDNGLELQLHRGTTLSYEITNIQGRVLVQAGEQYYSAGSHRISLSPSLAPGVYFIVMRDNRPGAAFKLMKK